MACVLCVRADLAADVPGHDPAAAAARRRRALRHRRAVRGRRAAALPQRLSLQPGTCTTFFKIHSNHFKNNIFQINYVLEVNFIFF